MRPVWLLVVASACVAASNGVAPVQIIPRHPAPDLPLNATDVVATPLAPTALPSTASETACGGRTVNAPNARLFYCDELQETTASTALDGSLCATGTGTYTTSSSIRTDAPIAAATITVEGHDAPQPVATVTSTMAYPLVSKTVAVEETYWTDVPVATRRILTAAVPELGFTMTFPTAYVYFSEVDIIEATRDVAQGQCVTTSSVASLPTPIHAPYLVGEAPEAWRTYAGAGLRGPLPGNIAAQLSTALGVGAFQPGTYAGRPTVAVFQHTSTLATCPTPVIKFPLTTPSVPPASSVQAVAAAAYTTTLVTTIPPAWGSVIASIWGITIPVPSELPQTTLTVGAPSSAAAVATPQTPSASSAPTLAAPLGSSAPALATPSGSPTPPPSQLLPTLTLPDTTMTLAPVATPMSASTPLASSRTRTRTRTPTRTRTRTRTRTHSRTATPTSPGEPLDSLLTLKQTTMTAQGTASVTAGEGPPITTGFDGVAIQPFPSGASGVVVLGTGAASVAATASASADGSATGSASPTPSISGAERWRLGRGWMVMVGAVMVWLLR